MFSAEQLLDPISAEQPCGADLSFSSELDAIAHARRHDDPSLDQGEWVTDLKEADWAFVEQRSAGLLAGRSKDLRLAVWLAEAAAKEHRLRGLGEAYRVLAGLCERYWNNGLYPLAEDGDQDQRIGNLSWILARTPALLREVPLTEGGGSAYSTADFESARRQAANPDPARGGGVKLADMEAARSRNTPRFREQFAADAQYCMASLLELERVADACLGADSPGFSAARDALQTMLRVMPAHAAARPEEAAAPVAEAQQAAAQEAAPAAATATKGVRTRAQALTQLRDIARFFRNTEPHSPVSYYADKAADAGEQDLHTWLRSVVKDAGSLAHIEELLGVPPQQN